MKIVEIYTDGGVIKKNPSEIGGTWAWVGVDADGRAVVERYGAVPCPPNRKITNNHTEQIAIVKALEEMPDGWSGKVLSDSNCALGRVFKGRSEKNLPKNISERSKKAVRRLGEIETVLLQGHPTKKDLASGIGAKRGLPVSIHNVRCDELCGLAAKEFLEKLEDENEGRIEKKLNEFIRDLENDICPAHKTKITKIQVGKCVYAKECGCRLYQGKI